MSHSLDQQDTDACRPGLKDGGPPTAPPPAAVFPGTRCPAPHRFWGVALHLTAWTDEEEYHAQECPACRDYSVQVRAAATGFVQASSGWKSQAATPWEDLEELPAAVLEAAGAIPDRFDEALRSKETPDLRAWVQGLPRPVQEVVTRECLLRHDAYRRDQLRRFAQIPHEVYRGLIPTKEIDDLLSPPCENAGTDSASERADDNQYTRLEAVGFGGMGVVYKAIRRSHGFLVALKEIREGVPPSERRKLLEGLRREIRITGHLDHRNVLRVLDAGEEGGRLFFTMPYIEGGSLFERIKKGGPLSSLEGARLVKRIAEVVHAIHGRGVVHRDLKPQNILLDKEEEPLVADFGLAKWSADATDREGEAPGRVGTPEYMPPEQAVDGSRASAVSDVYGLGAILYQVLTGQPPFPRTTLEETLVRVKEKDPDPPRKLVAAVARDVEVICLKCLQKDPAKRYASAQEFAADLGRYLNDEPIRARPVGRAERLWRWCRRRPLAAAAAATFLVSLVAVFAVVAWSNVRIRGFVDRIERHAGKLRESAVGSVGTDRRKEVRPFFEDAVTFSRDLVAEFPKVDAYRYNLARDLMNLGAWHLHAGDILQANSFFEDPQCGPEARRLFEGSPDRIEYRSLLAHLLDNRGVVLLAFGQAAQAAEHHREALKHRRYLDEGLRGDEETRAYVASTLNHLGNALQLQEKWDDAEKAYRQALAILDQLEKKAPRKRTLWQEKASGLVNFGELELKLACLVDPGDSEQKKQRFDKAEKCFRQALRYFERLAEEDPTNLDALAFVGVAEVSLGVVDWEAGRPLAARGWFDRAQQHFEVVLRAPGGHELADRLLPLARAGRAWAMFHSGEIEEGLREVEHATLLMQNRELPANIFARVACVLAKASAVATDEKQREMFVAKAIAFLERAGVDRKVLDRADFDPLRNRETFLQLQKAAGAPGK